MLTEEARAIISAADATANEGDALQALRALSVDEFGQLLLDPSEYAFLSSVLPRMASDEVQKGWTGAAGMELLRHSTAPFMRFVECAYARATGKTPVDATIIDYGCGWGRYSRMAMKYTAPANIWGLDPLEASLQFCRDCGVKVNLRQIAPMPETLPVDRPADLAMAYSVFTHTSENTTRSCLSALARAVAPGGVLVFTVRPVEFWAFKQQPELAETHRATGFAFAGDGRIMQDGEDTYGHASMSREFASRLLRETGWALIYFDHALQDEFQLRVAAVRA